jgi:hypothetical protein
VTHEVWPDDLSDADLRHLQTLGKKEQLIRDRVGGIAKNHASLILTGRGGIGKSWTVIDELARLKVPYQLLNSHLTGRGLFDHLEQFPDDVHVMEDLEDVFRDKAAMGVLRSATWASGRDREGKPKRTVTWNARGARPPFVFHGGIIIISNRPLGSLPELDALATRVPLINLRVSDHEVAALMRQLAASGHSSGDQMLEPRECREVVEFVIAESIRCHRPLNMRLMSQGYEDRLLAEDHAAGLSWHDLLSSRIAQQPDIVGGIEPVGIRQQLKAQEMAVAREIVQLPPVERLHVWKERTQMSSATMYRRLAELGKSDALRFDY